MMVSTLLLFLCTLVCASPLLVAGQPDGSALWRKLQVLENEVVPSSRADASSAYCNELDLGLVMGGLTSGAYVSETYVIDFTTRKWVYAVYPDSIKPSTRVGHTMTVLEDRSDYCDVLLLGGGIFQDQGTVFRGDSMYVGRVRKAADTGFVYIKWFPVQSVGDMAAPKIAFHNAQVSKRNRKQIFVLGNYFRGQNTMPFYEVNITISQDGLNGIKAEAKWGYLDDFSPIGTIFGGSTTSSEGGSKIHEPLPSPRYVPASAVINDTKIVMYGGYLNGDERSQKVAKDTWLFDIEKRSWQLLYEGDTSSESFRRYAHSMVGFDEMIWLFGGMTRVSKTGGSQNREVYHFDRLLVSQPLESNGNPRKLCDTDKTMGEGVDIWCEPVISGEKPDCRSFHSAFLRKDTLVIFGGQTDEICGTSPTRLYNDLWELNLTQVMTLSFAIPDENIDHELHFVITSVYLFFGLIVVTLLIFFVQVVRRARANDTHSPGNNSGDFSGEHCRSRGASITKIRDLPKTTFSETDKSEEACPICLGDYDEDDTLVVLPCKHFFHPECVEQWLVNNDTCPLCKRSISYFDEENPASTTEPINEHDDNEEEEESAVPSDVAIQVDDNNSTDHGNRQPQLQHHQVSLQ